MIRFVLADLRRLWAASLVIVLLVALATALGVAVTLQERALRLGSARAADKFDLIVGAPGSETQLVLSSVFLQPAALPLMSGEVLTKLIADPRVAWAAPIGFGDNFSGYPIVGTTTALVSGTTTGFIAGGIFTPRRPGGGRIGRWSSHWRRGETDAWSGRRRRRDARGQHLSCGRQTPADWNGLGSGNPRSHSGSLAHPRPWRGSRSRR